MDFEDRYVILIFGLLGSATFFIGFLSAIMANIRYALLSSVAGMAVGGLSYILSSHWTFGYMMGGVTTFIVGMAFAFYYLAAKLEIMNYFAPEHHTAKDRKRSSTHEKVGRTSGSWK